MYITLPTKDLNHSLATGTWTKGKSQRFIYIYCALYYTRLCYNVLYLCCAVWCVVVVFVNIPFLYVLALCCMIACTCIITLQSSRGRSDTASIVTVGIISTNARENSDAINTISVISVV